MTERCAGWVAAAALLLSAGSAWAQPASPLVDVGRAPLDVVEGRIGYRVEPFADGLVRVSAPSEVRVVAANGLADTQLTLSFGASDLGIGESRAYRRTVSLPRGSRKAAGLTYVAGRGGSTRVVSLMAGRHAATAEYPVTVIGEDDVGIAVIGDTTLGVNAIGDAWGGPVPGPRVRDTMDAPRQVRVGLVPLDALPTTVAPWTVVEWVVWPDPDPATVGPAELDALRAWVADGGHLFLTVSDRWRALAGSPLAELLPVTLDRLTDHDGLGALVQSLGGEAGPSVAAPVVAARLSTDPARGAVALASVTSGDGSIPVWAAGAYGLGTVHVLLTDPLLAPLSRDLSREALWRRLLWLPPVGAPEDWLWRGGTPWEDAQWASGAHGAYLPDFGADASPHRRLLARLDLVGSSANDFYIAGDSHYTVASGWREGDPEGEWEAGVRELLAEIPGVAPLPLRWLVVFAGVYLLLIGPVDYFVLRALNRQAWTWVTFPITIVVFSTVALVGTSRAKGSQAVTTRVEVIDVLPATDGPQGPLWRGATYLGVWATRRSDLVLRAGFPGGSVMPLSEPGGMWSLELLSTESGGALSWRAETWTLGYARTTWVARQPGRVVLEPRRAGGWQVRNQLGVDLERAHLVARGRLVSLGPLPDGGVAQVDGPLGAEATLAALEQQVAARGVEPALVDDVLDPEWVEHAFLEHPEVGRGHLSLHGGVALLGFTRAPFEPLELSGLEPNTLSMTLFRVPLSPPGGAP